MKFYLVWPAFFIAAAILFTGSPTLPGKAPEGEMFGVFSNEYATPHIAWAKPYIRGKLKILIIAPLSTQRESVELWQRLDCEVFPVMTAYGADKPIDAIGSYCGDISADEVKALGEEAFEKAGDWDVAIVARTSWAKLPGDWRLAILLGVRQRGAGLILIQQNPEGELKDILQEDAPLNAGNYFENIIPWNDLPAFCRRNAGRPNTRLAQYGQGRIAAINYFQKPISPNAYSRHCLTPGAYAADAYYGEDVYRWHSPDYDYYLSLVVRTILWAAQKEALPNFSFFTLPQARIERERLGRDATVFVPWPAGTPRQHWWLREKAAIRFGITGEYKPPVELEWLIRNRWNEIEKEGIIKKIELAPGIGGKIELPVLPAGRHYLEARLKKGGKTCDWAIIPFSVESEYPQPIIKMDKQSFRKGEPVSGKVWLAAPLPPGAELNVEIWDNCDRLLAKAKLAGQPAEQFRFAGIDPLIQSYFAKAALIDKDGEIISARVEFLIPRRGNDDFQFCGWHTPVCEPISGYYLKRLEALGLDSIMPAHEWVTPRELIEHCQVITRANLRIFPLLDSLCGFGMSKIYNQQGEPVCATNGCLLHDLPWQAAESGQYREKAGLYESFAPQGVVLSEENGFDFKETDRCFCPKCKESFRKYLEAAYKTLPALNASWGTNYKSWGECNPIVYKDAQKTGQLPRWVDHRMHMMKLWTDLHLQMPKPFEKYAPEIEPVFFGDKYEPYYGMDLYRLYSKYGRTFGISDYIPKGLCNAPGYGSYPSLIGSLARKRLEPWAFLSQGANGAAWYTIEDNRCQTTAPLLSASFESLVPYFAATLESVREIKRGPGKLIIGAKQADYGIRVLESPASMMVGHFSRQENTWSTAQKEFIAALDHAGLPYSMMSSQQVLDGKLEFPKVKVLILPFSQALSKQETENILAFAKQGGTVIADFAPGIMDEHGKKLAASGLAALFPEMKSMAIAAHGKGQGVYLGNLIRGKTFSEGLDYSWMDEFIKIFKTAGIQPAAGIFGENKTRDYTLVSRLFEDGENKYLFLIRGNAGGSVAFDASGAAETDDGKAAEEKLNAGHYQVVFPGNYHVYDLRPGKYLNYGKEASLALGPEDMKLLSLLPYQADKMTIKTAMEKERQVSLQAALEGRQNSLGRHVFRMTLIGPDGKEMPFWGRNVEAPGGKYNGTFPFALNDPPGKYTITVADIATGIAGKSEVEIK